MFSSQNGDRPDYPNIGLLITDGRSSNTKETFDQAVSSRLQGIDLLSIGVKVKSVSWPYDVGWRREGGNVPIVNRRRSHFRTNTSKWSYEVLPTIPTSVTYSTLTSSPISRTTPWRKLCKLSATVSTWCSWGQ